MVDAAGLPALEFSLSHCRWLVVAAVALRAPVGLDVEFLDPAHDAVTAESILAPGERAWLARRPRAERARDFLRLWTAKEAYAKLLGRGVALDFSSFEIGMDPLRLARTETGGLPPVGLHLATHEVRMPDGFYQLSLAAQCPGPKAPEWTYYLFREPLADWQRDRPRRAG
ncbi:MAG: 4'-phosphopantetheinyl transferase superfamily protein [Pirellulales bacterium]|nr:4'-phosphopantetheinyl transferase superfamily protein [Pirellulales bacterium]